MAYIGTAPAEAYSPTAVKDSFNGDGSTVAFTMSQPSKTNDVRVVVENVIQDPTVAYSCSGTTITFTSAPPVGTANVYVVHLGLPVQSIVPPDEINIATTYTTDLTVQGTLTANDFTVDTDTLVVDSANNRVGVGTTSPYTQLEISSADPIVRFNDSNGGTDTKNFEIRYVGTSSPDIDGLYFRTVNDANTVYSNKLVVLGDGSVGIGTDSPSEVLEVRKDSASTYGTKIKITNGANYGYGAAIDFDMPLSSGGAIQTAARIGGGYEGVDDGFIGFYTTLNSTLSERARIDKDGRLMVGKTSGGSISTFGNELSNVGYAMHSRSGGTPLFVGRAVSTGDMVAFYYGSSTPNTFRGSISTNGTSISYNTTSDRRLKENVTDLTGAIDRVKQTNVHRFNFIENPDLTVDGFIADEIQTIVPEAVTGTQDEVDEDGNPVYQCIDQSKLVPLLTQALKDAITKIEALEVSNADLLVRLEALENGA